MTDYCTTSEASDGLPEYDSAVASDALTLARFITRASRRVDEYLGLRLDGAEWFPAATGTPEERDFYGAGLTRLLIDHHAGSAIVAANVTMPEGYTVPYFVERGGYLVTTNSAGVIYRPPGVGCCVAVWPDGVPVTIEADWGYDETPGDIATATADLVAAMWRQREADPEVGGDVGKSFAMPPEARRILDERRNRIALVGAA